ncbi:MAG: 3-dehydroquinate synthase [Chloroflexaceae bacterium]|nr:3-dehydroquinate synthase [Chloroflexaceae bacterium]NJO05726.1 3-dehydroquinate synthase [Chloroflexaceae bacterium]
MTDTLIVTTPTARYPVLVEPNGLATLPAQLATHSSGGVFWLVCDNVVWSLYGAPLVERLQAAGHTVYSFMVPSGEASKSIEQYWQVCGWLIENGVERRDTLLALGGGVVGDLAGFVAASVLRGIAFVQLPTTLLAMVDAAIGGKTGINHPLGKNLVGAFHHPRLVLADTLTLRSLPRRELAAGWAEVIKHGVIRDANLFAKLEAHAPALNDLAEPLTGAVIRQAAAVKVGVVSEDEREAGLRMILNYGHTLGHALEAATGYGRLLHGEAVAIGMHAAAGIAVELGMFSAAERERQQRLLYAYGLPTLFPRGSNPQQLVALTLRDKKVQRKKVRWIVPTAIGRVTVRDDVPEEVVLRVVESSLEA